MRVRLKSVGKALRKLLREPGSIFRYRSMRSRAAYHLAAKMLHPRTTRRRLASRLLRIDPPEPLAAFTIPEEAGYLVVPPPSLPGLEAVLAESRQLFAQHQGDRRSNGHSKAYLNKIVEAHQLGPDSALAQLALDSRVIRSVTRYLGVCPLLDKIELWYSPNDNPAPDGSQFFHLDHEDARQVKLFVYIEDVTPAAGPLTIISAAQSKRLADGIGYRMTSSAKRVADEVVYQWVPQSAAQALTGPAGTMAFVDTGRCFHFGSRAGDQPRLVLMLQYLTPYAFTLPWRWEERTSMAHLLPPTQADELRQLVAGAC